jgi:hypothetical protein
MRRFEIGQAKTNRLLDSLNLSSQSGGDRWMPMAATAIGSCRGDESHVRRSLANMGNLDGERRPRVVSSPLRNALEQRRSRELDENANDPSQRHRRSTAPPVGGAPLAGAREDPFRTNLETTTESASTTSTVEPSPSTSSPRELERETD